METIGILFLASHPKTPGIHQLHLWKQWVATNEKKIRIVIHIDTKDKSVLGDWDKYCIDNPVKTQWVDNKEEVPSKYVKKIITTKKYNQLTKEEKEKVDEWNKTSINPNIRPYKYVINSNKINKTTSCKA